MKSHVILAAVALMAARNLTANSHSLEESPAADFSHQIAELFSDIDPKKQPGCSVGVIEKGQLIHKAGYGSANLEMDIPLDGSQVHRVGSVSKQFTAMAVLLLAEEGKINLEDNIRKHIPGLKDYGVKITINAMLGHFAGMADYDFISGGERGDVEGGLNLKSVAGGPFRLGNEDYLTIAEFYELVKTVSLRHSPDERLTYSNLGYFLLAMLVEEVSGQTLREYTQERIFAPLGMQNTFFSDKPTEIVKNRASGYKPDKKGGFVTDMTNLFWVGDGGLHTTLEDMLLWDSHFYAPKIGKDPVTLLSQFMTPNSDFEMMDGNYANGQLLKEVNGRQTVAHGGGWLGVSAYYERYPTQRFSTVVFCNNTVQKPWEYSAKIAEIYFAGNGN